MLRRDLVEIINSGSAWAFIGSGPSADAGGPTWSQLVSRVLAATEHQVKAAIEANGLFRAAMAKADYPQALETIENHVGRPALENAVRNTLLAVTQPSPLIRHLTQWPFAGYVTTNYDDLLWKALTQAGARGWSRVGNTPSEIRQISGEATRLVWHIHGGLELPPEQSRLILTSSDYESIYPSSAVLDQLRALLSLRRVLFVGFGFSDADLMNLLKVVGGLTDPGRPLFAMIPMAGNKAAGGRQELRRLSNIQSVPYLQVGQSHAQLERLLTSYGYLIAKRSLQLNKPMTAAPSYDPETTGLLLYNELRLQHGIDSKAIRELLIRSRVLAYLKHNGPTTQETLVSDVAPRTTRVAGQEQAIRSAETEASGIISDLLQESLVQVVSQDGTSLLELDAKGVKLVDNHSAASSRLARQFRDSLVARAAALVPDSSTAKRISTVAEPRSVFWLHTSLKSRVASVDRWIGSRRRTPEAAKCRRS